MTEEWRNSEAQVIQRGRWTRLNGTDTEILIPHEGGAVGAGGNGITFGGAAGGSGGGGRGGDAHAIGAHSTAIGGGGGQGGAGAVTGHLVIRVRRATSAGS